MVIEKHVVLPALAPLFPRMSRWWNNALQKFVEAGNDEYRINLGTGARATNLSRLVLAEVRKDEVVARHFSIRESRGLECLVLEGDDGSPGLSLVFNKAKRDFVSGRLRTAHNSNRRRTAMRQGRLFLDDTSMIPIVCYYTMVNQSELVRPEIECVGVGLEGPSGFEWVQTVWSADAGLMHGIQHDQGTLIPQAGVTLRSGYAATAKPAIGVPAEEERNRRDAERRGRDVSSSGSA